MRGVTLAFFLVLCATRVEARDINRSGGIFLGGGLSYGLMGLDAGTGNPVSRMTNPGYLIEGGVALPFGHKTGLQMSAEVGQSHPNNLSANQTYIETGEASSYAMKAGIYYGSLTIGGGVRKYNLKLKSLSSQGGSSLETSLTGQQRLAFVNLGRDIDDQIRAAIEFQYYAGTLKSETSSVATTKINETVISLRLYFLF